MTAAVWSGAPQEIVAEPDPEISVIGVALCDYDLELFKDDRHVATRRWQARHAQIMPAGVAPRAVLGSPWRMFHLYMPQTLVREAADDFGWSDEVELRDPLGVEDQALYRSCLAISRETLSGQAVSRLRFEGLSCLLAAHLVRRWSNVTPAAKLTAVLAPWQIARCVDLIHEQFADELSLERLAAEARLSPFHFARAFRRSTGQAPHQYQMTVRLKAAQRLLVETGQSVCEIANAVGYADQGTLTKLFRRELGTTPSNYRRERRK